MDTERTILTPGRAAVAVLLFTSIACGGGGAPARTIPEGTAWSCGSCDVWDIEVDGDIAFLADKTNGIVVLDVRDPAAPKQVGAMAGGKPSALALKGDVLYVSDYARGLVVVDVTDLAHPTELMVYDTSDSDYYVEVGPDARLYSATQVFDLTDPKKPEPKGRVNISGSTVDAHLQGTTLWLASANAGLSAVDVADPMNPKILGTTPTNYSKDVCVSGTKAYVTEYNDQTLEVFDVSNPAAGAVLSATKVGDAGTGCALTDDGKVAVAAGRKGILLFDVSDPAAPKQVKATEGAHSTYKVFIAGGRVWGADQEKGIVVLDL